MWKKIVLFLLLIIIITTLSLSLFLGNGNKESINIDLVLESEPYSYLPLEIKEYIKDNYLDNGELLLTEKNKEPNKPYINPAYITYSSLSEEDKEKEGFIPQIVTIDYSPIDIYSTSPSSYDLRNVNNKNYTTPNRDQGDLGICWAFASAGATESYLLKSNDTTYNPSTSTLISERQIDYATSANGIEDYDSEYNGIFVSRYLGDGGNFYIATLAMASGISLYNYNDFEPYDDTDLDPKELHEVLSYHKSSYTLTSTINMFKNNDRISTDDLTEEQIASKNNYIDKVKEHIMEYGSAVVSTYMYQACAFVDNNNNTIIDVYNCLEANGHSMNIIGWNDDYEYTYCADDNVHNKNTNDCNNIVNGRGVWILRNSWGNTLKNPYLTYDSLDTEISFVTGLTDLPTWNNNYLLGEGPYITTGTNFYLSNTKVSDNELLKEIKFITYSTNGSYKITIYGTNNSSAEYDISVPEPGLYTFTVPDTIYVDNTSRISISGNYASQFVKELLVFTYTNSDQELIFEDDDIVTSKKNLRLYSDTKNIPSNESVTYKLFDDEDQEYTTNINVLYNYIAENNTNPIIQINNIESGNYILKAYYNDTLLDSLNIEYIKMNGDGTEDNPYVITNANQLNQIREEPDAYYVLNNDIDLSQATRAGGELATPAPANSGTYGWKPIENFSGSLDGQGHSIIGLYQQTYIPITDITGHNSNTRGGLFGSAYGDVTIKNLTLKNFDMTCYKCGALLSEYNWNPDQDDEDDNYYEVNIENVYLIESTISEITYQGISSLIYEMNGNGNTDIEISNIYINSTLNIQSSGTYVIYKIEDFDNVNIHHLLLTGNLNITGVNRLEAETVSLVADTITGNKIVLENFVSTVYNQDMNNLVADTVLTTADEIDGHPIMIRYYSVLYGNSQTNVRIQNYQGNYMRYSASSPLDGTFFWYAHRDSMVYNNWENFEDGWKMETINGVYRMPILKNLNIEYSNIPDINIDTRESTHTNIYNILTPDISSNKRITYKIKDTSIASIDANGTIYPLKYGTTTIHVRNYYDGFEKDIPITVNAPTYNISFDSNGGTGTMDSVIAPIDWAYKLPANTFTRTGYIFTSWNTKQDGSGETYTDLQEVENVTTITNDNITLYAQWEPIKYYIKFMPNGGTGTMPRQQVLYDQHSSLNDNEFTKEGCNFLSWNTKPFGDGDTYHPGDDLYNLKTEDGDEIYLYAQWTELPIIPYTSSNYEGVYDGEEHTITLNVNLDNYTIHYSVIGIGDDLTELPSFTAVGEYIVNYRISSPGYADRTGFNLVKIYGIKSIYESLDVKGDILVSRTGNLNDIINNINIYSKTTTVQHYNKNNELVDSSSACTGDSIKIIINDTYEYTYIIAVLGDINSDSRITSADYIKIRKHIMQTELITNPLYFYAADVNKDNAITSADYIRIRKYIMTGDLL